MEPPRILPVMRITPLLSLTLGLSGGFLAAQARAQSCTSNAECEPGFECQGDDVVGSEEVAASDQDSLVPGEPFSPLDAGPALPAPVDAGSAVPEVPVVENPAVENGSCVPGSCASDGDCAAGFECNGRCEPIPLTCEANRDCPEPATCRDGACVFVIETCTTDDDCDPNYVCTVLDPSEPTPPRICFPEYQVCEVDADCEGDWGCWDVPDPEDAPGAWRNKEHGCIPPGIEQSFLGQIEVDADAVGLADPSQGSDDLEGEPADGTSDAPTVAVPDTPPSDAESPGEDAPSEGEDEEPGKEAEPTDEDEDREDEDREDAPRGKSDAGTSDDTRVQGASEDDGDGGGFCALSTTSRTSSSSAWLLFASLAFLAGRRARR